MTTLAERLAEINEFALLEGLKLPMPAEEIVNLEDLGLVVDLRTGQILEDIDPDAPIDYELGGARHDRQ